MNQTLLRNYPLTLSKEYRQLSQRYTQSTDLNYHMLTLHILSLSTADPIFRKYRNKLKLLYNGESNI